MVETYRVTEFRVRTVFVRCTRPHLTERVVFDVLLIDGLVQRQGGYQCRPTLVQYHVNFGPFNYTLAYFARTAWVQNMQWPLTLDDLFKVIHGS